MGKTGKRESAETSAKAANKPKDNASAKREHISNGVGYPTPIADRLLDSTDNPALRDMVRDDVRG